jgi:predicted protein tyrosine phosphatase
VGVVADHAVPVVGIVEVAAASPAETIYRAMRSWPKKKPLSIACLMTVRRALSLLN